MRRVLHALALGFAALLPAAASAEDIDIYFGSASGGNPNVLVVLDNTSNWSANNQNWATDPDCPSGASATTCKTQGYYELKALKEVIRSLPSSNEADPMAGDSPVNVGLMLFNRANSVRNGGFVRFAMQPMTAEGKADLLATIDQVIRDFNDEQGPSSGQYAALLFDAFKYFGGYSNPANASADSPPATNPTFGGVPVFGTRYWGTIDQAVGRFDPAAYSGDSYLPAGTTGSQCSVGNTIIFIGNGFPSSDTSPLAMDEALQKLMYPGASTPVAQNPLPVATCASAWANVTGSACQSSSQCLHKFAVSGTGILDSTYWSRFGVSTSADFSQLIGWIRGADNKGDESGPGGTVTIRPSVHGDVLHSRPVALNYSSLNKVVIFYGSNDGLLRAVDAGKADSSESAADLQDKGKELWSFIAPEHFGQFKRLRDAEPQLKLGAFGDKPKDYFFDGSPGVYQEADKAWLFVPMRRGGRFIYAFDVSTPSAPKFMWKISNASSGFSELGQTWSTPRVTKLKGALVASDGTTIDAGEPVLIFGAGHAGGYDAASPYDRVFEDRSPAVTSYGYSRGVFVVQARTGKLIRFFQNAVSGSIARSVPSDVTLVDQNYDGYTDTAYVGDLGGNLWRMDLDKATGDPATNDAADWTLTRIANLAGKFFYPPDVVLTSGFRAVLIGSGDREDPKRTGTQDYFYMVKDTGGSTALASADLLDASSGGVPLSAPGWQLTLRSGEKVVNGALTVGGVTYFGTNQPETGNLECTGGLGVARAYAISFLGDTPPADTELVGGGLPPSPVSGIVEIVTDSGEIILKPFMTGTGTDGSSIEVEEVKVKVPPVRKRTYWYLREDQ